MRRSVRLLIGLAALFSLMPRYCMPHCQIPCGIYDDRLRIRAMLEDATTIDKATALIEELSDMKKKTAQDRNQIVRWVNTKEEHADRIQHTVLQYFLAQRVKPTGKEDSAPYKAYLEQLKSLHSIVVLSMKAKQEVNGDAVRALREAILEFAHLYLPEKDREGLE